MVASAARGFVRSLASPRRDTTTSSDIAVNVNAVKRARLTINSKLFALAKIVRGNDSPEGGMRCAGIKIYPFLLSSEPLS
jgi:hypothetical protein